MAIIRMETTTKTRRKAAAAELLVRKAARTLRALRKRLTSLFFFLASPRRRTAMAAASIRALSPQGCGEAVPAPAAALAPSTAAAPSGCEQPSPLLIAQLLQQVLDDDDGDGGRGGYPDSTHCSMFDGDDEEELDNDVDRAADLFIRRVRARINEQCRSEELLGYSLRP